MELIPREYIAAETSVHRPRAPGHLGANRPSLSAHSLQEEELHCVLSLCEQQHQDAALRFVPLQHASESDEALYRENVEPHEYIRTIELTHSLTNHVRRELDL